MKLYTTTVAALFGLFMIAMPSIASADYVRLRPVIVHPVVVEEVVAPAPFTTVAYYRPWACANGYFRRHHRWLCR